MQEIADRAGVARTTVSNVLNGRFRAERSDAARRAARIRRIADELNFRPSAAARATRTGRTGLIGLLCSPSFSQSVHVPDFEMGLLQGAHERGLCIVKDRLDQGRDGSLSAIPRILREKLVDGVLINYAFGTPRQVRDVLERCQIPTIWINRKRNTNCVRPNDEGAAFEATRHLIAHGHTDIAFVIDCPLPDVEPHYCAADRVEGYRRAMEQARLRPRVITTPSYPATDDPWYSFVLNQYLQVLATGDRPTAVLCLHGRAMLLAAERLGVRVPRDLSVVTFDNEGSLDVAVAVDRVLVPNFAMGRHAVHSLCSLIEGEIKHLSPVVLPFEFHITGTVAPPSKPARQPVSTESKNASGCRTVRTSRAVKPCS
jgi:LacI family transcriptional regulator